MNEFISPKELSKITGLSVSTLKQQRYRGSSKYEFKKGNNGKISYQSPEVRCSLVEQRELNTLSTSKAPCSANKVKLNSGKGFHSKSRYQFSQLKIINERRKKMKEERLAKQRIKDESSLSHEPLTTNHGTRDFDRPRRKFRGYGYGSEPLTEVVVPRSPKPLTFKNKIQEYIHIAKQSKL